MEFSGNMVKFTNALWTGAELLSKKELEPNHYVARVKLLNQSTPNHLLGNILPHVEILGLKEILPSMNDVFIHAVSNSTHAEITL